MRRRDLLPVPALALAGVLAGTGLSAAAQADATRAADSSQTGSRHAAPLHADAQRAWRASWATAPQRPSVSFQPNWSEQGFANQTVRQVVRPTTGGHAVRIRLSNAYGTIPLKVAGVTIARTADGAAVSPGSLRHLTVKGSRAFTIAPGAELDTDAAAFRTTALKQVSVTLYLAAGTGPATYHAQALATTYRAGGDHRADTGGAAFTERSESWYFLSGLDVRGGETRRPGVVTFGDSITDGTGSTTGTDSRYPDELAERLIRLGRARPVLNEGIGGNRVTIDSAWLGDAATGRFRRDVLGRFGVGTVIIFEGVNDLGISELTDVPFPFFAPYTEVSAAQIIAGHRTLIRQARGAGLRVIGATITPVKGSPYYTPRAEAKRDAVNAWIRTSGEYDAVVDLDRVLAAPGDADALDPAYDSGDHLHPNDAGYRVMAAAVDPADLR